MAYASNDLISLPPPPERVRLTMPRDPDDWCVRINRESVAGTGRFVTSVLDMALDDIKFITEIASRSPSTSGNHAHARLLENVRDAAVLKALMSAKALLLYGIVLNQPDGDLEFAGRIEQMENQLTEEINRIKFG